MAEAVATKGLGQIEGLCACYTKNTLNGRPYDKIYKKILAGEDYRFNAMMERGGILCEFGHPAQYTADFERTETDPEKACALITKIEEREDGKIYATATVLDTPAGRIYKAIAPFYTFGFSSRGSYEPVEGSTEGPDGWNQDSYVFKGFDIVALPANEGSQISALESYGPRRRKPRKSARESLDLQNIADAASVDPKEVDAELDKIFAKDGNLLPAEYVDAREFSNDKQEAAMALSTHEENNVVLDLQKALADKASLDKQVQQLLFHKAENEANMVFLQSRIDDLEKQLEQAQAQIDFYTKNKEEIDQLVQKLVSTHDGALAQSDEALKAEQEHSKSLAAQVADLQSRVSAAEEQVKQVRFETKINEEKVTSQLDTVRERFNDLLSSNEEMKEELEEAKQAAAEAIAAKEAAEKKAATCNKIAHAAREALIDTYSNIYSINRNALAHKVGRSGDAKYIKSVAESLSNDVVRLTSYSAAPIAPKKITPAQPSYPIQDDVDRELFAALKSEGKL